MKKFALAVAALLVLGAQPLMADSFGSLADVIAHGNSITFGDKTFSHFATSSSTGPNVGNGIGVAPGASNIAVDVSNTGSTYVITFSGFSLLADGFAPGDLGVADLKISFDVHASAALIDQVDQLVAGSITGLGHAYSDETVTWGLGGTTSMHTLAGGAQTFAAVGPTSDVHVLKDVNVLAVGAADGHISAIEQSFHQTDHHTGSVPEIDASVFASALTLLIGCVAVMFGRKKVATVVG